MIIDIDDKAREKIKLWDKDISDSFSIIFDLISYDFFDINENVNISSYKGNKLKVTSIDNQNVSYISYTPTSDIFDNRLIISDNNKSFGYEINKDNHGINLTLKGVRKNIDNNNFLDISMLSYGIVVKIISYDKVDILEFRGKKISIDYYKLMFTKIENIRNISYIISCIVGDIDDIVMKQYDKNNYFNDNDNNNTYKQLLRKK